MVREFSCNLAPRVEDDLKSQGLGAGIVFIELYLTSHRQQSERADSTGMESIQIIARSCSQPCLTSFGNCPKRYFLVVWPVKSAQRCGTGKLAKNRKYKYEIT